MVRRRKPDLRAVADDGPSRAQQYIEEAAQAEALRFVEYFDMLRRRCESPIEELLIAALFANSKMTPERIVFCGTDTLPAEPDFDECAFVYQQACIGPYRTDIAIWDATLPFNHTRPRVMIVECDGHDFHERTKAQARRDKQRDRFLQSKGFKVLRFTGSEIWADPDKCADEIIEELACNDSWRNRAK